MEVDLEEVINATLHRYAEEMRQKNYVEASLLAESVSSLVDALAHLQYIRFVTNRNQEDGEDWRKSL